MARHLRNRIEAMTVFTASERKITYA
jgi:hypothetical protein